MIKTPVKILWALGFISLTLTGCHRKQLGITPREACVRKSSNYSALLNCFDKITGGPADHEGKMLSNDPGYPTTLSR